MDSIARQAGLSKGALYLYFDSKDALFEALIHEYAEPRLNLIQTAMSHSDSAISGLYTVLDQMPVILRKTPVPKIIKVLISDSHAFPHIVGMYRDTLINRMLTTLTELLQRAKDSGELHIESPQMFARLVVAPFIFSVVWTTVFEQPDSPLDLEALVREQKHLLGRALSQQGATQ